MPSPRPHPRKRGEVPGRSKSFHGRASQPSSSMTGRLLRPKTMPNLPSARQFEGGGSGLTLAEAWEEQRLKLTKLLLNVTIQGSLGPVMVLMTPESSVADLVATVVKQYVEERRRPVLTTNDTNEFNLHFSQFSLDSLDRVAQLQELGSRNFFLCRRPTTSPENATTSCSKQADKVTVKSASRPRFLGFL